MKTVLIGLPCLKVGGTEIQTLRLVEALISAKYHVITVCYFEYDFSMVQQYQLAGSKVECLSAYGTRPQGIISQYRFLRKGFKRIVREYKPDVAHVQYMAPGALPIVILKSLGLKTIIATSHTMGDTYKSLLLPKLMQRCFLRAFTCITRTAEESFFGNSSLLSETTRLRKRNHFTIYNSLSQNYCFPSIKAAGTEYITIGIVSRLALIKGVDLVIPAFAELCKKYSNLCLMIVGEGALKEEMVQQEKTYGLEGKVQWFGKQPSEKLPSYYQQMDIVWIPSRSEGFGLSALEAMANGCAVVASRTGGLPEVIQEERVLFENENIKHLTDVTAQLLDHQEVLPQLREQMQQRARQFQFENYSRYIQVLYSKL